MANIDARALPPLLLCLVAVALLGGPACSSGGSPGPGDSGAPPDTTPPPVRSARMSIECSQRGHPINPMVYGVACDPHLDPQGRDRWSLNPAARRWGGNTASRYNWELGKAWNAGSDWFFCNVADSTYHGYSYQEFLEENVAHDLRTALAVPMLGWVARDTTSCSFPVSVFGPQRSVDPFNPEAGDGVAPDGAYIPPGDPRRTSVESPPESLYRWVRTIRDADAKRGGRSVNMYILDNEPTLWHETHRDVHPEPVGYDELLERTIAYGEAVRFEDPGAVIAGPALWGWQAMWMSAKDAVAPGETFPDRNAHGGLPLLAWYLQQLHEYELRYGRRLLDIVDVHFYPQGEGLGIYERGATDPETAARRIRSTRALWDPEYVDESWIADRVQLIPRIREWIDQYYPGRGISIGEYNFGAEGHMSGGLAVAEALGRFGEQGIDSAFYWTCPANESPAYWAFRAFRNFDGQNGRFQDWHLPAHAPEGTSLFASISGSGDKLVAVALNLDPDSAVKATIDLDGCAPTDGGRRLVYEGGPLGFKSAPLTAANGALELELPPYSISIIELGLSAAGAKKGSP